MEIEVKKNCYTSALKARASGGRLSLYPQMAAVLALASCVSAPEPIPSGAVGVDIERTVVSLVVELGDEVVLGEQVLTFTALTAGDRLSFDTGPLRVTEAALDGVTLTVPSEVGGGLVLPLPEGLKTGGMHALRFAYDTDLPSRGVVKRPGLLATTYFACDWMVCNQEDFADRFQMRLNLDVPDGAVTLGPGVNVATSDERDGRRRFVWATDETHPAYVHAFAVGDLTSFDLQADCDMTLEIVSPPGNSGLEAAFAPTCEMLTFFEEKAGVPFPRERYAQLYVPSSRAAQEAVSHSVIGGTFLDPILDDPSEDWVIAHELAHQWWGNGVTAADLSEFWLNEGIVTFMVAAWKEHRWGREAYDREIALARRRWQGRLDRSGDVPLTYNGPYASVGTRFSIQYSKGAVFLHELRGTMGDEDFWAGFAQFTRDGFGTAVTSRDFERAMQAQTDVPLGPMFATWVYHD